MNETQKKDRDCFIILALLCGMPLVPAYADNLRSLGLVVTYVIAIWPIGAACGIALLSLFIISIVKIRKRNYSRDSYYFSLFQIVASAVIAVAFPLYAFFIEEANRLWELAAISSAPVIILCVISIVTGIVCAKRSLPHGAR